MNECSPALHAFRSWSCADRNGMTFDEASEEAAARRSSGGALGAGETVLRSILNGELATAVGDELGGVTQRQVAIVITFLAAIACCAVYATCKLGSAACRIGHRHPRMLVPVHEFVHAKPRGAADAVPTHGDDDDEIFGDEPLVEDGRRAHEQVGRI